MPILANMCTMAVGTFHRLLSPVELEIIFQQFEEVKSEVRLTVYQRRKRAIWSMLRRLFTTTASPI
jgi:hypothetical protein